MSDDSETDAARRELAVPENELYESLLDVTTEPVYAVDSAERFVHVNDAFVELTGYERSTLLDLGPRELIHETDVGTWDQRVELLREDATTTSDRWVSQLVSKHGTAIPVEWYLQATDEGVLLGRAIDERQSEHRERKLEVLNRALRHNIRNQMNIVIGKAATLQAVDDEGYRTAAEKIEEIGKNVVNISNKARRAQEHVDIPTDEECQTELVTTIETVVTQFAISYPEATVRTTLPESALARAPPSVDVALSELLENAVVHHPRDGGVIEVVCHSDEQQVCIEIRDECEPVPEGVQETIQQGTEQPLRHNDGLGLWIVWWVVDAVDGELAFERREDGQGNAVCLRFERIEEQTT